MLPPFPDSVARFSGRVEDYIRCRPSYPPGIADLLVEKCGLTPASVIADIGSGSGILTRLFLDRGNVVHALEPNDEMRTAAEHLLATYPGFHSLPGSAEASLLPDRSVDFVTAAQAFHWFDAPRARVEFARILRPGGWVALVWNERRLEGTPFLDAYEKLLVSWGLDYEKVAATYPQPRSLESFFHPMPMRAAAFENVQRLDFDGLRGRLLSASYAPRPGHPNHQPMLAALRSIFDSHQQNGRVAIEYDCRVYYGQLTFTDTPGRP